MTDLDEQAAWIRENRRAAFWRGAIIGAAAMLLLTTCVGCATVTPTHVVTEVEHVSHITTPECKEVGLSHASVFLRWKSEGGAYFDAGLGYNLQGRDGGGFIGSAMTSTVRFGKEWRLR